MDSRTAAPSPSSTRYVPPTVTGLTLLVFAAAIWLVSVHLRTTIRQQILSRDGEVLNAAALLEQSASESAADLIENPIDQLAVVLRSSKLRVKEVLAVRLYNAQGDFVTAFPYDVSPGQLASSALGQLAKLQPVSLYHAKAPLSELFLIDFTPDSAADQRVPLLEVRVPIHPKDQNRLVGIAQFFLDGSHIGAEFAKLDRQLLQHGAAVFLVGGAVATAALAWAFRRLQAANRLLAERTTHLLRANQELALAAKTSAVGAVTAHLIHGLKNPLSGLQSFVASGSQDAGMPEPLNWQDAVATTRRMQSLVNDIVRVLREEDGVNQYEITLAELIELLGPRIQSAARQAGVNFQTELTAEWKMTNREANLLLLILENLLQNAIQATPKGRTVQLVVSQTSQRLQFAVCDEGPGLTSESLSSLFTPCHSAKPGGTGIGLALSKQLAKHLGADLELTRSSSAGCVFTLSLPILPAGEPLTVQN